MQESPEQAVSPVLELTIEQAVPTQTSTEQPLGFSAAVVPGQLVYVQMQHRRDMQLFVSMFLGLDSPASGHVKFCGLDWQAIPYDQQFYLRSRIGRVFAGPAWIQNLTVAENLWLAQLNQGQTRTAIQSQVNQWLPRLAGSHVEAVTNAMGRRPAFVNEVVLQICQLLRAMAFEPRMLILEWPLRYLPPELHDSLVKTIEEFNHRGGATIWFDTDREPVLLAERAHRRWEIKDEMLMDCEAA